MGQIFSRSAGAHGSLFDPKQPLAVGGGGVLHLLRGQALELGDGLGHAVDIAGVTALAAVGGGGHVGGIRLNHEALQRHGGDDLYVSWDATR